MRTGAHAEILPPGPASRMVCEECGITEGYPRTAPAQAATRRHNRAEHAHPGQLLEHTDTEEIA